jgi:dihydrofolate reductase
VRKVILLMHISLDGYVAGPNGEMDWIRFDDDLVKYVDTLTASADVNLFGRATYQMMEYYWPTAADQPDATQHDKDHARWVNAVEKVVFSQSLEQTACHNARIVRGDVATEIDRLKQLPGKNMVIIGSPSFAASLMGQNLIDEYWLNINPVVLGGGNSLFKGLDTKLDLKLLASRTFDGGVVALRYGKA